MNRSTRAAATALIFTACVVGCGAKSSPPPPAAVHQPIPANSPLAKVHTGMTQDQVTQLLGSPTNHVTYESGKRWIPFYYGGDVRRTEWSYKGLGRVIFTGGNQWGGAAGQVERVDYDPTETGVRKD